MNHYKATLARVSRVALVGLACGCMVLAGGPFAAADNKEAEQFRAEGEKARKAIEDVRDQLQKTVEAYDMMLASTDKKLQSSHKKLASAVEKSEKVVASGKKDVTTFQETAKTFFVLWEQGVASITTASIQEASEKRLEAARKAFAGMDENLAAAREAYEPFIGSLKEQVALTSQDLSPGTVALLKEEVAPELHAKADEVFAAIEDLLTKEKANEDEVNQILDEEGAAE